METIKDLGLYTFPAVLANSLRKFSERPALALIGKKEITYKELGDNALKFSALLESYGLKELSKVAIFGTGCPEWGTAYFGIVNRRMIAVPLLPDFSETEVESILNHCGVDALVVEGKLFEKIKNLSNALPPVIIKMDDYSVIAGEKIKDVSVDDLLPVEVKEEDTASIIYTSGTTGRSKGVELTHKNLVWDAVQGQYCHRVNKLDRCLSFLPLSHVYEFTIGFTMQVMNGSCVYYLGKPPIVSALLPAFTKVQPTIVLSVPLVMEKIYKNKVLPTFQSKKIVSILYKMVVFRKIFHRIAGKQLKKTFGGYLNFFGIGGAKVDPAVERFMKDAKFPYAMGYGLTETSPFIAGCDSYTGIVGTIGHVIPDLDLQLINKDEKTGVGEIVVKGPNVMKGYYKAPELTAEVFTTEEDSCGPGYLKTGDLGTLKKYRDGVRLSLKGRCKNMILGPNGENIYPEDLEFVLNQHPMVSESLVVEDDNGLVALVQIDEEKFDEEAKKRSRLKLPNIREYAEEFVRDVTYQKEAMVNEIQFFVNTRINKNSRISRVQLIEKFEKTASQKIKRYLYDLRTKASKVKEKLKEKK